MQNKKVDTYASKPRFARLTCAGHFRRCMEENEHIKETESVFTGTIVLCLLGGIFGSMLLDGGVFSDPAVWFYFPMSGYLFVRFLVWKMRGQIPKLSRPQRYGISLSPVYGFVVVFIVSTVLRSIRAGRTRHTTSEFT